MGKTTVKLDDLPNGKPVILFDGVCNLCQWSVQIVIKNDPKARFQFAAQQSDIGQSLIQKYAPEENDLASVLLIDERGLSRKSTAALRTAKYMVWPWNCLYAFIILPRGFRDWAYDIIGSRRYKWFGKKEVCWMPEEKLKERFLD